MVSRLIGALCLWLWLAGIALAVPATSSVSGIIYNGAGSPLTNATVIFNTPQQTVGGDTIAPSIISTRTNASGQITAVTLVQGSLVLITINAGQVITGIVPTAATSNISQVLTGTSLVGTGVQVNGVNLSNTTTINFEDGTGVAVTNPSLGNIQFTMSTATMPVVPVTKGGTGLTSGTSGGIPYFSSATTMASSAALTANLPVIGGGAGVAPSVGTRSGNTTAYVTTTGAQTSGQCVQIDANGNHVASGAGACASGGGFANIFLLR